MTNSPSTRVPVRYPAVDGQGPDLHYHVTSYLRRATVPLPCFTSQAAARIALLDEVNAAAATLPRCGHGAFADTCGTCHEKQVLDSIREQINAADLGESRVFVYRAGSTWTHGFTHTVHPRSSCQATATGQKT